VNSAREKREYKEISFTMKSAIALLVALFLGLFDAAAADPSSAPVAAPVAPEPAAPVPAPAQTTSYSAVGWWAAHNPQSPMSEQAHYIAAYNGFKAGGQAMLATDPNWQLCIRKSIDPSLMVFNYNAMANSCNPAHIEFVFSKVEQLVNSILVSRGLSLVEWSGGERIRRVLRGDQDSRRLACWSCAACPTPSYFCLSRCPNCRRREEEDDECLPIRGNSFSTLEGYAESVKSNMMNQCVELLKDLSQTDQGELSASCKSAISLSNCEVFFELANIAELHRKATAAPSSAPSSPSP
jgi:hypothetical protein